MKDVAASKFPDLREVLVVDDHVDSAEALAAFLCSEGLTVVTAYDGSAALALAQIHQPRVIVLDLRLGSIDGCDVARDLRAPDSIATPFLIAYSADFSSALREATNRAGFDRHFLKPNDFDLLVTTVREASRAAPDAPSS